MSSVSQSTGSPESQSYAPKPKVWSGLTPHPTVAQGTRIIARDSRDPHGRLESEAHYVLLLRARALFESRVSPVP
jgi:hypothetical protein